MHKAIALLKPQGKRLNEQNVKDENSLSPLGVMKGARAPFRVIRRTGFAGPRRIFAEARHPGAKKPILTDLPPGKTEGLTGKSA